MVQLVLTSTEVTVSNAEIGGVMGESDHNNVRVSLQWKDMAKTDNAGV